MSSEIDLILIVGSVHIVALGLAAVMLWHFMRAAPNDVARRDDENGPGGGNLPVRDPEPRRPRDGGLPLPDALPARVRLREPGRIAGPDRAPRRPAHPVPAPARRRAPA